MEELPHGEGQRPTWREVWETKMPPDLGELSAGRQRSSGGQTQSGSLEDASGSSHACLLIKEAYLKTFFEKKNLKNKGRLS